MFIKCLFGMSSVLIFSLLGACQNPDPVVHNTYYTPARVSTPVVVTTPNTTRVVRVNNNNPWPQNNNNKIVIVR